MCAAWVLTMESIPNRILSQSRRRVQRFRHFGKCFDFSTFGMTLGHTSSVTRDKV